MDMEQQGQQQRRRRWRQQQQQQQAPRAGRGHGHGAWDWHANRLAPEIFPGKEPAPGLGFRILLFCRTVSGARTHRAAGATVPARVAPGDVTGALRGAVLRAHRPTLGPARSKRPVDSALRPRSVRSRAPAAHARRRLARAERQDIRDLLEEYRIGNLSEADRKRAEERSAAR